MSNQLPIIQIDDIWRAVFLHSETHLLHPLIISELDRVVFFTIGQNRFAVDSFVKMF